MKKSRPEATAISKCILRPFLWTSTDFVHKQLRKAGLRDITIFKPLHTFKELEIAKKNVEKSKIYHILQQREKSI